MSGNASDTGKFDRPDLDQRIGQIWRDVLSPTDEQEDATFFELQGQSISAVRIVARIEDELGLEVDIGILFEDPDLRTFVSVVMGGQGAQSGAAR